VSEPTDNPRYRWGVLGIVMLGTSMAILDASIVNVALPHMMSAFAVNRDQIEWVSTGFMLASAVAMPLMGWLANRIEYKTLYLSCLLLFTVASGMCAVAWSFKAMLVARVLQAIGGGAIQPIGMSIIGELFEPHERGRALGIWGTGIMVAPAIGPTLGGYLTDVFSWRTIFSVNLPAGAVTLALGMLVMRPLRAKGKRSAFDGWGYLLLAVALVAGLTALSNGQQDGWDSTFIRTCEAIAFVAGVLFIAVELTVEHPLLDLRLFLIRNYTLSLLLAIFRSVGLFGGMFLFPILLQNLMGYTTIQSGLWTMPTAISVGIAMPIAGRLADSGNTRLLTATGALMVGGSLVAFGYLDPLSSWQMLVVPQIVRGLGLALMMAPLLAAALNAVPRQQLPMASSFLNVAQRLGGSLGIAILNNAVTRSVQYHAVRIATQLPPQSQPYLRFAERVAGVTVHRARGMLLTEDTKAAFIAADSIYKRAQVMGFANGFFLAGIIMLAGVPFCLLLKPANRDPDAKP
jgi:DHA2 family multidrug resistance protein